MFICFRHIIKTEGLKSLFRGLGPNLIGVAPSRYHSLLWFNKYCSNCNLIQCASNSFEWEAFILSDKCVYFYCHPYHEEYTKNNIYSVKFNYFMLYKFMRKWYKNRHILVQMLQSRLPCKICWSVCLTMLRQYCPNLSKIGLTLGFWLTPSIAVPPSFCLTVWLFFNGHMYRMVFGQLIDTF